ncbi:aminopeptidase N [Nocardioides lijunqiniae]|uniref:aminopeptidase N n=1 Tax=Nocardioides lijunqiniae TaxID=2760832 RepID=UPI001878DDBD|nr:aminopeptidase N [Nocardioides lijunqiniae]
MGPTSLTMQEAAERAALIAVERYDIEVDLRGLLEGEVLASTSTVTFTCREPGATTFVDCVADVLSATLNGVELDPSSASGGRIPLPGLAERNVLVVSASQSDTGSGAGMLRTVDPSDGLVYFWTSFEPDEARRAWACFDQPDLKAPHAFTVHAPESWTVLSNCGPDAVEVAGGRTWRFPDTPPLSTYVVVVNAGPFHEQRSERGGHDLGIYCRQSLRAVYEREAEELFTVTAQGLAFFAEAFGTPFPQRRYDHVFVPNMGGAMENWGCVTWGDSMVPVTPPTYLERIDVANVLLHEMAHQWFGDLVTMRWWDDLWLNEAFASWAADWALEAATDFDDAWAVFLVKYEILGYRADMGPGSHPIRSAVDDVESATANFDDITYLKGQAVLRQLVAYAGEEAFFEGLRSYFRDHAYANTTLDDLMDAIGAASGRDLSGWTRDWLDRAGTDTLTLVDGRLEAAGPDGEPPRPHRLDIGCYVREGEVLRQVASVPVEVTDGGATVTLPDADLVVVNDGDLTFAAARAGEAQTRALLEAAPALPTALARALAVTTAWDRLVKGELATAELLDCVLAVLERESSPALVEPLLSLARQAAERFTPDAGVAAAQERLAAASARLVGDPEHRRPALRTLAVSATTDEHLALLEDAAADDVDLAWRLLVRRAALDIDDEGAVAALLERDPNPESAISALGVTAARPDPEAKARVWAELFEKRSVPAGRAVYELGRQFWQPGQTEILLPYVDRYLDEAERLSGGGMLDLMSLMRALLPSLADARTLERGRSVAQSPDVLPAVRSAILTGWDTLARMQRAKER